MISGVGIDIVQVASIAESIREYGKEYLERMFTQAEIAYCDSVPSSAQRYAARIAAKEAAMKALATGWDSGVEWLDFEIVNRASGEPTLRVHGRAAEILQEKGVCRMWISLSHRPEYAIAQVVLEQSWIRSMRDRLRRLYRNVAVA
jgi:holo-[acyl-carrier protein] synthase